MEQEMQRQLILLTFLFVSPVLSRCHATDQSGEMQQAPVPAESALAEEGPLFDFPISKALRIDQLHRGPNNQGVPFKPFRGRIMIPQIGPTQLREDKHQRDLPAEAPVILLNLCGSTLR